MYLDRNPNVSFGALVRAGCGNDKPGSWEDCRVLSSERALDADSSPLQQRVPALVSLPPGRLQVQTYGCMHLPAEDPAPSFHLCVQVFTTIVLSGFVEFKRLADIRNPGSQGSGILPEVRAVHPAKPVAQPAWMGKGSGQQSPCFVPQLNSFSTWFLPAHPLQDFKGVGGPQGRTVGGPYVGGRYFDPMGLTRGSPEQVGASRA